MTEHEKAVACAQLLIKILCVDTNATEAKLNIDGFFKKETGEILGDYEIVVKKN